MPSQISNSVAEVLLTALSKVGIHGDTKTLHEYLRAHPVRFVKDGILHQIFSFDRGQAAWVGACNVAYEGNSYNETSTLGDSSCMSCIAEE